MLKNITDCDLPDSTKIAATMLQGYCAFDTDSHALLRKTRGRGKSGLGTFILIVPTIKAEQSGDYFKWNGADILMDASRFTVRAWTQEEAIEKANKRLRNRSGQSR
jgi:hypothetical protein